MIPMWLCWIFWIACAVLGGALGYLSVRRMQMKEKT